jgi:hypothetical protein
MNNALTELASAVHLDDPGREGLRFAFALACVERIEHLLEDARAAGAVGTLRSYVAGTVDRATLIAVAHNVRDVARSHRGSHSLDGSQHAAVSATNALAHALEGRALDAANYAAYASVYAYGGYAVSDPSAFAPEVAWQVKQLQQLAQA